MYFKLAAIFIVGSQLCAALPAPACTCTRQLTPVCGSNGVTYGNQCLLECAQTSSKRPINVSHQGSCAGNANSNPGSCGCSTEYIPVCGTDGQTYPNTCHLSCNSVDTPSLRVDYEGECRQQNDCFCIALYQPVCGSDGVTYSNDCQLNCATAQYPTLSIAYRSACV